MPTVCLSSLDCLSPHITTLSYTLMDLPNPSSTYGNLYITRSVWNRKYRTTKRVDKPFLFPTTPFSSLPIHRPSLSLRPAKEGPRPPFPAHTPRHHVTESKLLCFFCFLCQIFAFALYLSIYGLPVSLESFLLALARPCICARVVVCLLPSACLITSSPSLHT